MTRRSGYGQFCPVAKAAEIIAERWTPLVLRELTMGGCRRFNDIHRGVPLMSKSLLSKRLRELEDAGLIERREIPDEGVHGYFPTEAGEALRPIILAIGEWGQRYAQSNFETEDLDPALLVWDMRRCINTDRLPDSRTVIEFEFTDQRAPKRRWWLLKEPGGDELAVCLEPPGYDVDIYVSSDLETMARVWLGELDVSVALRSGALRLEGSSALRLSFQDWIGLSIFAHVGASSASG